MSRSKTSCKSVKCLSLMRFLQTYWRQIFQINLSGESPLSGKRSPRPAIIKLVPILFNSCSGHRSQICVTLTQRTGCKSKSRATFRFRRKAFVICPAKTSSLQHWSKTTKAQMRRSKWLLRKRWTHSQSTKQRWSQMRLNRESRRRCSGAVEAFRAVSGTSSVGSHFAPYIILLRIKRPKSRHNCSFKPGQFQEKRK